MESLDNLENLKTTIEKMNNHHQIEVLRILSRHLCKLNENKSGVFINLSYVDEPVIEELQKYIKEKTDYDIVFVEKTMENKIDLTKFADPVDEENNEVYEYDE